MTGDAERRLSKESRKVLDTAFVESEKMKDLYVSLEHILLGMTQIKDAALERRFQQVLVKEPTIEDTISILRGLKEKYEVHHGIRIKDSALVAAATLSNRYITDRFLPDKAVDLVDECASLQIQALNKRLAARNLSIQLDKDAMAYLAEKGYDPGFGARPLKRVIQQEIENPLSMAVLKGDFEKGTVIRFNRTDNGLKLSSS